MTFLLSLGDTMKQNIKLIALDLDGTTFTTEKTITPKTKSVIETAIRQGIHVLPATGRQVEGLPDAFLEIPGVRYALTSNGASVVDLQTKKPVFSDLIPYEEASKILSYLQSQDTLVDIYQNGTCYIDASLYSIMGQYVDDFHLPYFHATRNPIEDLPQYILDHKLNVEKYHMLFQDMELRSHIRKTLEATSGIAVTTAISNNLEVNAATTNKGVGVLALADILGIDHNQTMVIGDSYNDVDMMKAAGFSVAMGNAPDDIKSICDAVTKTNDEDGVAYAIETFVL